MSDSRFNRVKKNTDFVNDVNSDVKPLVIQTIKTKNSKGVIVEVNKLKSKERSRSKHGRNLTNYLFVEELEAIELAVEKLGEPSISNFVRQTLLDKCQSVLGNDEYNRIIENKRNVIKK